MSPSEKKKPSRSSILLTALLIFFITVFVASAAILVSYIIKTNAESERYESNDNLNAISKLLGSASDDPAPTDPGSASDDPTPTDPGSDSVAVTTEPTVTAESEPQYGEHLTAVREQIFELQKINPDIVGYISVPLLDINYPLLSRRNDYTNSYYLRRAFDYSDAVSGSIFYDYRCDPDPMLNRNTVIYGHNMRNGSMFGNLTACVNNETKFHHAEIIIATLSGIYTFKLFSVYRTTASINYCRTAFSSDDEFNDFYKELQSRSLYKANYSPSSASMILTLSTCTNTAADGRYALHALLTKIER